MTMRQTLAAILVAPFVALSGCASHLAVAPVRTLSLPGAVIVPEPAAPTLDVDGLPGGKAGAGAVGAGSGFGYGALAGAAACLAAGPFAPLCLIAVVPTASAVGAVTGGVVGATRAENADAIAFKTVELTKQLSSPVNQFGLAQQLQAELLAVASVQTAVADLPAAPASGASAASRSAAADRTQIEVAVVEIATEGKREFAIRFVTRARVRLPGQARVAYEVSKEVQSEAELAIGQWMAGDAAALHAITKRCLRQAAHDLAVLMTAPATARFDLPKYSSSCNDVEDDWKPLMSAQANAGDAGLPAAQRFAVGDRWEWRQFDNRTQVEEQRYSRSVVSSGDKLLFAEAASTATAEAIFIDGGYDRSEQPWRIWPLEVGKKWTFEGVWHRPDGGSGRTRQEMEIAAYEEVIVPAGKFLAFRIEARGFYRNAAGGGARQNDTYWYAPAANCDVKHVRQDDRNSYTQELVSYSRRPTAEIAAGGAKP